ncbi:MAG: 5-bromo-4-chloroindolyl phosphate hydrolysis family protein [Pseudomonadota bacterium]
MSAKRFGGAYSPGAAATRAASAVPSRRVDARTETLRPDPRARLMYILPAPLLVAAITAIIGGNLANTGFAVAGFAGLMASAWLANEGVKAERAYNARAVARRPAIPRKLMSAPLSGIGVACAQMAQSEPSIAAAIGFGLFALACHLVTFGIDPLSHKGIDLSDAEINRVAGAIEEADKTLTEIQDYARQIGDREIGERLASLGDEVRGLLHRIEADPSDLGRARRYLSVHLVGAHEATRKYAEAHDQLDDPQLRADYIELLGELEASFARGREKMKADERTGLEVEIEVLRERLGRDGA